MAFLFAMLVNLAQSQFFDNDAFVRDSFESVEVLKCPVFRGIQRSSGDLRFQGIGYSR